MAAAYLFVNKPVASLQADLDTGGDVTLVPSVEKFVHVHLLPSGRLRILVFGVNQDVFSGRFADVSDVVTGVHNVVCAAPDGSDAQAIVAYLNQPANLRIKGIGHEQ